MSASTYDCSATTSARVDGTADERFLYLYLSLIIAIFSILTILTLQTEVHSPEITSREAETSQETIVEVTPLESLHGAKKASLVEYPLELFTNESRDVDTTSFQTLLFLLRSHNVDASVSLYGDEDSSDSLYGKALTLQSKLQSESLSPTDVRVEVVFGTGEDDGATLSLRPHS